MKKTDEAEDGLVWKELRTETIVKDEWIDFRKSAYLFPDGHVYEPYYTYSRRDYVVIVATDEEGRLICVRQFRQGIKAVTTEFVAGGLEPGEEPLDAARRELREETGYESDDWQVLMRLPSDATISDNYATIVTARNCRRAHSQDLDAMEFLRVETLREDEIEDLISGGQFQQAMHVMAWLLFLRECR